MIQLKKIKYFYLINIKEWIFLIQKTFLKLNGPLDGKPKIKIVKNFICYQFKGYNNKAYKKNGKKLFSAKLNSVKKRDKMQKYRAEKYL
jgi:hypothetical protein